MFWYELIRTDLVWLFSTICTRITRKHSYLIRTARTENSARHKPGQTGANRGTPRFGDFSQNDLNWLVSELSRTAYSGQLEVLINLKVRIHLLSPRHKPGQTGANRGTPCVPLFLHVLAFCARMCVLRADLLGFAWIQCVPMRCPRFASFGIVFTL